MSNAAGLGDVSGATTVASGAGLYLNGGINVGDAISVSGSGVGGDGVIRSEGGSNTLSGLITLSADSELQADAGTNLTLDVSSGNALSGDFTLTVDAEGDVTIADAIATSSGGLTKTGAGTLIPYQEPTPTRERRQSTEGS